MQSLSDDLDPEQLQRQALIARMSGGVAPVDPSAPRTFARPNVNTPAAPNALDDAFDQYAPRQGEWAQPGGGMTPPTTPPVTPPVTTPPLDTNPGWFGRDMQRANPGGPTGGATGLDSLTAPPAGTLRTEGWQTGSGAPPGWDTAKWGKQNSMKYVAGEILARYPHTPAGLQQAVNDPDFKRIFPNAKLVGADKIDFGGMLSDFENGVPVNLVDVGQAFDEGAGTGTGWWWGDIDAMAADGSGGGGGAAAGGGGGGATGMDAIGSSESLAQIIAQIMALTKGEDPMQRNALMQMMQQHGGGLHG